MKKHLKIPNIQRFLRMKSTTISFFRRRIPLLIANCGLTYVKIGIYVCDALFTYESNLVISCLFASLPHQRFYCKMGLLFLSSKSMSKDEPGFRYICNFKASLSLQIRTYIWNLLLQVSTVLIMIVVKTGRR